MVSLTEYSEIKKQERRIKEQKKSESERLLSEIYAGIRCRTSEITDLGNVRQEFEKLELEMWGRGAHQYGKDFYQDLKWRYDFRRDSRLDRMRETIERGNKYELQLTRDSLDKLLRSAVRDIDGIIQRNPEVLHEYGSVRGIYRDCPESSSASAMRTIKLYVNRLKEMQAMAEKKQNELQPAGFFKRVRRYLFG